MKPTARRISPGPGVDEGGDADDEQSGAEGLAGDVEGRGRAVDDQQQAGEYAQAGEAAGPGAALGAGEVGAPAAAEDGGEDRHRLILLGQVQPGLAGSLVDQQ